MHPFLPAVDLVLNGFRALPLGAVRELQDEHNVNLNAAGEGDDLLDGDDDALEGLTIVSAEELFADPDGDDRDGPYFEGQLVYVCTEYVPELSYSMWPEVICTVLGPAPARFDAQGNNLHAGCYTVRSELFADSQLCTNSKACPVVEFVIDPQCMYLL
jgi:hypothetical protein